MTKAWETKPLADVAELQGRIGWKGLTAKEYTSEGPYFLSVHSLNSGDYVDFRDAFHISQDRYNESPEIMLRRNDVLICKDGAGIGKVGIVGEMPGPSTINSSMLLIRAQPNILPKYLYFILQSPYFQQIVRSRLEGATTPHLYQRDIATFPVHLPPLEDQRRIVAVLDEAFAAISTATGNVKKNLENLSELNESVASAWFEDLDAPLLPLSEAAERVTVGHVGTTSPYYRATGIPFLRTQNVSKSGIKLNELAYITAEFHGILKKSSLKPGDVLLSRVVTDCMNVGVVPPHLKEANCANVICIRPGNGIDPYYLAHLIQAPQSQAELLGQRVGSAQQVVNTTILKNWRVPVPSLEVQSALVKQLGALTGPVRELKAGYEYQLTNLWTLKQALLKLAFDGGLENKQLAA